MKQKWIEKYLEACNRERSSVDVLIGFNANIDVIYDLEELELDLEEVDAKHVEKVSDKTELRKQMKYAFNDNINEEVELEFDPDLGEADERVGGQAGIMSNFLSRQQNAVIFYTPFLSSNLADKMNEKILTPVMDGKFVLKNVKDSVSAERTKKNIIIEYDNNSTGRVIFSRKMKGFGPYFRKGIEDNFDILESNVDRAIFAGYHDVEGNMEAKLKKAEDQLQKFGKPIHLEYVHREETVDLLLEHILPYVDSIGLDEDESRSLADEIDLDISEDFSLGDAFRLAKELIKTNEKLERVHIHTYRFHVTVCDENYSIEEDRIRKAMLYGEMAAIKAADIGLIPKKDDLEGFEMDKIHLHRLDDFEHFEDFFDLNDFVRTGQATLENMKVVAVPTLIHEDPERIVGLGDIISSGAFIGELQ